MYILIDLGGTNLRIASTETLEKPAITKVQTHKLTKDYQIDYAWLKDRIKEYSEKQKISGIAMAAPGTFDRNRKVLIPGTFSVEWIEKPFAEELEDMFDCKMYVENDGVVGALGEYEYGEPKDYKFICLTWGTGIGGALVVDGWPDKLDQKEYRDQIEKACGGKYLEEKYGDLSKLDDKTWNEIVKEFARELEILKKKLDVEEIVVGGGITFKRQKDLEKAGIKVSKLGENINLYGCCALIK